MAVAGLAGYVVRERATSEIVRNVAQLLSLSIEQSIPTYFSAAMLLAAAGLLWTIARVAQRDGRPFARHWHWLGVIFVCLSLDEICSIHELTMKP